LTAAIVEESVGTNSTQEQDNKDMGGAFYENDHYFDGFDYSPASS